MKTIDKYQMKLIEDIRNFLRDQRTLWNKKYEMHLPFIDEFFSQFPIELEFTKDDVLLFHIESQVLFKKLYNFIEEEIKPHLENESFSFINKSEKYYEILKDFNNYIKEKNLFLIKIQFLEEFLLEK